MAVLRKWEHIVIPTISSYDDTNQSNLLQVEQRLWPLQL